MQFNVAQLLKGPTGQSRRYRLQEDIQGLDKDLEPLAPLTGFVSLMRTSQGILVTGRLRTKLQGACRRCLEPCAVPVEISLEEEYYPIVGIPEVVLDTVPDEDKDLALVIDERHILDLTEVVRQGLWLAGPGESLCKPGCAGLCPRCGGNRNLGECRCDEAEIDPRWAALQALLASRTESEERSD